MRMTIRALRHLISESPQYGMNAAAVQDKWPDEIGDAIEFVMCTLRIDRNAAQSHVMNSWVFDTLDHGGQTFLLARDEATSDSLAYQEKMGGWYRRLGDNKDQCRQTGSQRGGGEDEASAPTVRRGTGTKISGGTGTKVSAGNVA